MRPTSFYKAFFYLLLVAVPAVSAVTGCAGRKEGKVLARVGQDTITEDEFAKKVQSLPQQLQNVVLQNRKEFIEDLAAEHFLLKEAERRGIDRMPDVRDLLETARKKIIIAKLIETEIDKKVQVGPEEAQRYYESHKDEFMTPALFRASHILVKTQEEADKVKTELETGADFEETARKRSIDATAIRGGDLGFAQKGRYVPEFEEAALALKKGETSAVVKSRFGYHIIRLADRMEPTLRDFPAVKSLIEERLTNEKRSDAFKVLIARLKGNTQIKIDEQALEAAVFPVPAKA